LNRLLPAEWQRGNWAIQMTIPNLSSSWYKDLPQLESELLAIAAKLSCEDNVVLVSEEEERLHLALNHTYKANMNNIIFAAIASDDLWARDHGVITVLEDGKPLALDFNFDGWGGKYPASLDNLISHKLQEQGILNDLSKINLVLEGGSIETDGEGSLLTTSNCLSLRNPDLSIEELEDNLGRLLGVKRFLWLNDICLQGDDTDGHIDTLARFCDRETIVYASCDDEMDENFYNLKSLEEQLQNLQTVDNKPYRLLALPLPCRECNNQGSCLPASYCNFLIRADCVLMPAYADKKSNSFAKELLASCFPTKEIKEMNCQSLIQGAGAIHCSTMEIQIKSTP